MPGHVLVYLTSTIIITLLMLLTYVCVFLCDPKYGYLDSCYTYHLKSPIITVKKMGCHVDTHSVRQWTRLKMTP